MARTSPTAPATDVLDVLHALVLDSPADRHWGEVATPFQVDDAAAVLSSPPGAPRLHWLSRPKGSSKTTDTACMLLAWLIAQAQPHQTAYVFSSDLDQSNRLLARAKAIIARTPGLPAMVKVTGRAITHVRTMAAVEALAADAAGNEGLLSPLLVLEELANWPATASSKKTFQVAMSAQPKMPGGKLMVITHAGDPGHFSYKIFTLAQSSPRWRVNHVPGPTPWIADADLTEQKLLLLPSEYARRWLNIWMAGEDRLTSKEDLAACVTLAGPQEPQEAVTYICSLDMAYVNDAAVAAIMHRAGDRFILDRLSVWQGTRAKPVSESAVEAWLIQAHNAFNRALIRVDPWQTKGMAQRLRTAGIRVDEFAFTTQSVGRLALGLYRSIKEHQLAIFPDDALVDELLNVQLRQTSPGIYRMDHVSGGHDDRAVAIGMAVDWLAERPNPKPADLGGVMVLASTDLLQDAFRWRP